MDQNIGLWVVIVLTFIFMACYYWGRRKNYKIQKDSWKLLRKHIAQYTKKVDFKTYGSSAFQISIPGIKEDVFKRLELTIALLPREIPLYYLVQKIRGKKDEVIVKTQFRTEPKFSLEAIPKEMKVPKRLRSKFKEIKTESFKGISFFSSEEGPAKLLLNETPIRRRLKDLEKELRFLSLSAETPHLIFACKLSPEVFSKIFSFIRSLGLKLHEFSMTGKRRKNVK